ncbi:MAG: lysostaphin resistance A-like protein [bacterium]
MSPGGEEPEFPEDPDPEIKKQFANQLTMTILILEGIVGLIGLGGIYGSELDWEVLFSFEPFSIGVGLITGILMFLTHVILIFPGGEKNPLYRLIYRPFAEALLDKFKWFSLEDIVFVSVMSGLAEEILFRGWIQTELGIIVASVLFGLIHIWGEKGIPYGIYAIVMGFAFGGIYEYTGTLWAPIIAHVINNVFGLLSIKLNLTPELQT